MMNKKCEGIDCAWCTSNECPNEKESKMTDKQIIIDGVDVSGCWYFGGESMDVTHNCTIDSERLHSCEGSNCYFKQLARLNAQYNAVVEQNQNLQGELNRKTQECEDLKEKNKILMTLSLDLNQAHQTVLKHFQMADKREICVERKPKTTSKR